MASGEITIQPRCVASSSKEAAQGGQDGEWHENSMFCQAHFSGDGTTIVTQHKDRTFRTYVLPTDLLENTGVPSVLAPCGTVRSPSAIQSYALFPHFNLQDPASTVYLSSATDLPITINNALTGDTAFYKYPLIHGPTESFIAPSSLAWTRGGSHFVAGSNNQLAVFDAQANGQGPIMTHRTGHSGKDHRRSGQLSTCRGIVMALSISPHGQLAAGSNLRQVAIYDDEGNGECWTSFSLASVGSAGASKGLGVTHLSWSPCGTYLLVGERSSGVIQVYDIRNTMSQVSVLAGHQALTQQRLSFSVIPTADGYEAWAGGTDGCVRMWRNPGSIDGEQQPDLQFKAHDDPVSSTAWHPQGSVLATCSGRPAIFAPDDSENDSTNVELPADNTLKLWTV